MQTSQNQPSGFQQLDAWKYLYVDISPTYDFSVNHFRQVEMRPETDGCTMALHIKLFFVEPANFVRISVLTGTREQEVTSREGLS